MGRELRLLGQGPPCEDTREDLQNGYTEKRRHYQEKTEKEKLNRRDLKSYNVPDKPNTKKKPMPSLPIQKSK